MISLTRDQVRGVDRLAIEKYRIPGIVLMENAARGASEVALKMAGEHARIMILCGGGNNGGDGLAMARHLHNKGCDVRIGLFGDYRKYQGEALVNWSICNEMKIPIHDFVIAALKFDLIVDAVFGTGLTSAPRAPFDELFSELVWRVERNSSPVLAIDVPSGLDCDTGLPLVPCIRATQTVTFVAPKIGFNNPESKQFTGEVRVADIGCPREAIDEAIRMHP